VHDDLSGLGRLRWRDIQKVPHDDRVVVRTADDLEVVELQPEHTSCMLLQSTVLCTNEWRKNRRFKRHAIKMKVMVRCSDYTNNYNDDASKSAFDLVLKIASTFR